MRLLISLVILSAVLSGCAARVVEVDVNNQTFGPLKNIEVTFGGGTYGRSAIPAGASHHNRIKIFSSAPIRRSSRRFT